MQSAKQSLHAIALKLAQAMAFSLMYAMIKLAGEVPIGEVVFYRGFFALIPLFVWTFFTVGPVRAIKTKRPAYHVVRAVLGTTSMFSSFLAVQLLPLVTVTAFNFVQPIFAVILAALFLHEKVGKYRWGAVIVGFGGVLLMLEPHGGLQALLTFGSSKGVTYALVSAFLTAVVVVWIRQMSASERCEAIVFYFMTACATMGAIVMLWDYAPIGWNSVFWLVLCGLVGGVGQLLMTYSYRYAEPSLLAPFDYTQMIWAMLLGWFVLGEMPVSMVLWGAGVVIVSGSIIAWREHRLRLELPQPMT